MTDQDERWEQNMQYIARNFSYPPTPDLARRVRLQRRTAVIPYRRLLPLVAALVIVLITLMAVPEIRAAVLNFLRVGAVEIIVTEPPPPETAEMPTLDSILDLPGETTLEAAQAQFEYPILLPAYPADLGPPLRIFAFDGSVALVWLTPDQHVRFSLHLIPSSRDTFKYLPYEPVRVLVNGERGVWLDHVHTYEFHDGETIHSRIVTGNVLIWEQDDVTYRFETDLPLEEAIRVAESVG